jgi:hypothetical protein
VDHTGDGITEPYSITIDAQSDVAIAKVYERLKYITRRGADETILFGAGTNVPGESYRGLDALFEFDNPLGGGFDVEGDDIQTVTGGSTWTARLMAYNGTPTGTATDTYITTTDQQTSIDAIVNDDVITDEAGGDSVDVHSAGTYGIQTFTSPKSSPFGTFTGTQIFGARGVVFINPASTDTQAYILTDDLGTLNNPPNTVSFTVSNTVSGDRILVARDTGTGGIIDKDQHDGLAVVGADYNGINDNIIRVASTAFDPEIPQSGYVRIVDNGLQQEHHYVYDSLNLTDKEFNLRKVNTGSTDNTGTFGTGSNDTTLVQVGATFNSAPLVLPGMLIRNTTTNNDVYEVVTVGSSTTLTIAQLYGAGSVTTGNTYTINALIGDHSTAGDYSTADDLYDLILDVEANSTTVSNTFIKTLASNFGTVVNVRQGGTILPFTVNQTQGDGNTVVTVVRTPDAIFST